RSCRRRRQMGWRVRPPSLGQSHHTQSPTLTARLTMIDHLLPTIALVPGDCTGIGPEQTARILADGSPAGVARLVVVGDARVLGMGMTHAGVRLDVERIASPSQANWQSGAVQLVDLANTDPALFPIGKASAESGRLTGETLSR